MSVATFFETDSFQLRNIYYSYSSLIGKCKVSGVATYKTLHAQGEDFTKTYIIKHEMGF